LSAILFLSIPLAAIAAPEARLFLSSGSGAYQVGKDFSTRLILSSGGATINAAETKIKFDPKFLKVKRLNKDGSIFNLWPIEPKFSNTDGAIILAGGSPKNFRDTAGVIINILFTPLKTGLAAVELSASSSLILQADGRGKNILKETWTANFILGDATTVQNTKAFTKKFSGRILLDTQKNGEAWYVFPDDLKRYFLGRPEDAFNLMRKLGLGVKHSYIEGHTVFPANVAGKILIDVEDNGRAYYVNLLDRKAHYLGRPGDAFFVMRSLGLGIKTSDLNKIADWTI